MTQPSTSLVDTPPIVATERLPDGTILQTQGDGTKVEREPTGRFRKGSTPARGLFDRRLGRNQRDYLAAIAEAYPAEAIPGMLRETWEMAKSLKRPKEMHDILKTILAYQVGLPRRTVAIEQTNMNMLYEALFGDGQQEEAHGGPEVDGEYTVEEA